MVAMAINRYLTSFIIKLYIKKNMAALTHERVMYWLETAL